MNKAFSVISSMLIAALCCAAASANPPSLPKPAPLHASFPKGERYALPNGLRVYLLEDHSLPLVKMSIVGSGGVFYEPAGKQGLAGVFSILLRNGGSAGYTPAQVDETLDFIGASITSTAMSSKSGMTDLNETTGLSSESLSRDYKTVGGIFTDLLLNPAFNQEQFQLAKDVMADGVKRRVDNPGKYLLGKAMQEWFGDSSPYGWDETAASVASISTADVKAYYDRYIRPDNMILTVSGDFNSSEMKQFITDKFSAWTGKAVKPEMPKPAISNKRRVILVDKAVSQSPIFIFSAGPSRHDPSTYSFNVMNQILGGSGMSSRLVAEVRTRRGLAYSVGSGGFKMPEAGVMFVECGTKTQSVTESIDEILRQMKELKTVPPSREEVDMAKNALINSFVFLFKTPMDAVEERQVREVLGYESDFLDTYTSKIAEVNGDMVSDAAKKWLDPDNAAIYVEGDAAKLKDSLSKYGQVEIIKAE